MKKNRMMRLASILLVCVLLTTSVISGTFAKYTTTDKANDSARVAKWGIDVSVGGNLFGQAYDVTGSTDSDKIVAAATTTATVKSSGTNVNVIAPGTKNEKGFEVKISGTPEVDYEIATETGSDVAGTENQEIFLGAGEWGTMVAVEKGVLNAATIDTYYIMNADNTFAQATSYDATTQYYELHDAVTVDTNGYYPISWTLTKDDTKDGTVSRLEEIVTAIDTGLTAKSSGADANEDSSIKYVLTWEWKFNNGNDEADTILGNLAAADTTNIVVKKVDGTYKSYVELVPGVGKDYNLNVAFAYKITVDQVN